MEFFPCQPSAYNFSLEDTLGQFEWNPTACDLSLDPEAPRDLSDNLQSILTPDQVTALLAACEPSSSPEPFSADFSAECLNQALWDLPQCPEMTIPSTQPNNPVFAPPLEPIGTGTTVYRNGFGDPIRPLAYRPYDLPPYDFPPCDVPPFDVPPFDVPTSWEVNSTTSTTPSSIQSPCDSYAAYQYPLAQLASEIPANLGACNLVGSENYSRSSASSNVSSFGNLSEKPVKKHRCQICGRAFQRQTTLNQHQITHTGERPYACPVAGCDRAFTTASNAKRHAKIHFRMSHGYHHTSSSPGPY